MDEQNEPERIEIELTSHEPTGGPRRPARAGDGDGDESNDTAVDTAVGESSGGVLGTERGRLIAVTAFAGVVALLVGVLVGRSGSDGAPADGAATVTTALERTTTTVSGDSEVLPPVRTVVTAPPTTETEVTAALVEGVDPERPVDGVIEVLPEFADLAVEIIGLTFDREVIRINPATGATVTYGFADRFEVPLIHVGPNWILIPMLGARQPPATLVLADGGTRTIVDTLDSWPIAVAADGSERFWVLAAAEAVGGGYRMVEMSLSGEITGEMSLVDFPRLVDPLGGFIVDASGGSYRVTPEGATRLSPGRVVAVGRTRLLVEECDESLDCGFFVVDRESGDRRAADVLAAVRAAGDLEVMDRWFGNPFNQDEHRVLVAFSDPTVGGGERVGVLDIDTGNFSEIDGVNPRQGTAMRWAPNGRAVLVLDSVGRLTVIDLLTGDSRWFSDDLGALVAFEVRPLSPSDRG